MDPGRIHEWFKCPIIYGKSGTISWGMFSMYFPFPFVMCSETLFSRAYIRTAC